jgi:hypothetical protein
LEAQAQELEAQTEAQAEVEAQAQAKAKAPARAGPPANPDNHDNDWLGMFEEMVEYKAENGHCNVLFTETVKENIGLGNWVSKQRQLKKKYEAPNLVDTKYGRRMPWWVQQLNDLCFTWDGVAALKQLQQARWDHRFEQYQEHFNAVRGNSWYNVPKTQKKLGKWIERQRGLMHNPRIRHITAENILVHKAQQKRLIEFDSNFFNGRKSDDSGSTDGSDSSDDSDDSDDENDDGSDDVGEGQPSSEKEDPPLTQDTQHIGGGATPLRVEVERAPLSPDDRLWAALEEQCNDAGFDVPPVQVQVLSMRAEKFLPGIIVTTGSVDHVSKCRELLKANLSKPEDLWKIARSEASKPAETHNSGFLWCLVLYYNSRVLFKGIQVGDDKLVRLRNGDRYQPDAVRHGAHVF